MSGDIISWKNQMCMQPVISKVKRRDGHSKIVLQITYKISALVAMDPHIKKKSLSKGSFLSY
jgi:hypothetical protein